MEDYQVYLILINIFGLLVGWITLLQKGTNKKSNMNLFLEIISLCGGSFGVLLSFVLLDRKIRKENAMVKIFVLCLLIIQITFYLMLCKKIINVSSFSFYDYFIKNKFFLYYLILINVFTFIIYGVDKYKAIHSKRRVKIATLLFLAFLGGSIGSILAMYLFRHKTNKTYFKFGIPLILVTQIIFFLFLINL